MSSPVFLSARGVRKSFGQVEVLHGVDLDLAPGTVTALLGENGAGKSTFVRIIAGDYQPDTGVIELEGVADRYSVAGARKRGIRLISQEISDAPPLTVAENVVLGSWPLRGGIVDYKALRREAKHALDTLDASDLDLNAPQSSLRLGERQIVEVARAIRGRSNLVIFDEPTAALSDAEAKQLYKVIANLTARGVAVLYITHRLDEVFAIADRVCVLRDGVMAMTAAVSETTPTEVVEAMVGHRVERSRGNFRDFADAPTVLEGSDITGDGYDGVSFTARRGEILGLYGKVGSGVLETAESLFGARAIESGSVSL
uniref:ATP-binding cassette domain-containing protein n=1 Tax=Microbacterium sp. TaxID=51671 RepID=UPI0035ADC659